ncbi:MAG TPA: fasciclin domain-containing protein [Pyrinomonadaceae bacterium]
MKKTLFALMMAAAVSMPLAIGASAQMMGGGTSNNNPMVGGAPMYRTKNIVENAVNSADHTTLVAAVKAAGLVETLQGKGPFTVFAPTNTAFDKLPSGTVETLVKPENKATLTKILTYHVVAGKYDAKKLMQLIKKGGGQASLRTVSGGTLTARMNGMNGISLTDEKGGTSNVTTADVYQSNGVIHVIDTVVMPN